MALTPFDGPIPGQSLTREPGSAPWERPPQYADPIDALEMYMEKLAEEEVVDNITDMLELGVPVTVVAGAMLTSGAMNGLHTIDVKVLLRPILSMHIKSIADVLGIDYKMSMEDYRDKEAEAKERRARLIAAKLKDRIGKIGDTPDEGDKIMMDTQKQMESGTLTAEPVAETQQAAPQEEMPMEAAAPKGLMAKE